MSSKMLEFDLPHYQVINEARAAWLTSILAQIPNRHDLRTALDVGCGAGYFSNLLNENGLEVTGIDLQAENVAECRARYPHLTFSTVDVDQDFWPNRYDLVLMFGVLYHLQNPLLAIQRLCQAIEHIGIVSTRVAAGTDMGLYLYRENVGPAHNRARVTAVPTLHALIAMFHLAKLDFCYLPKQQPRHPEWDGDLQTNGRRYSFVVSRKAIPNVSWSRMNPGTFLKKWQSPHPSFVERMIRGFWWY